MNGFNVESRYSPNLNGKYGRALVASGFWLRIGFIGVSAVAISLLMYFDGDATGVNALAGALAGGIVAAFAWRRSWLALDRVDDEGAEENRVDAAPSARLVATQPLGFRAGVETAAHR